MKRVKAVLDYIKRRFEEWNGATLFIDDFDPQNIDIAVEVSLLSDGHGCWHSFQIYHEAGGVGNVGVIVGQGRYLDLEDPATIGFIHVLLANGLKKLAKRDRFIKAGVKKLELLEEKARALNLKPRYIQLDAYGRVMK